MDTNSVLLGKIESMSQKDLKIDGLRRALVQKIYETRDPQKLSDILAQLQEDDPLSISEQEYNLRTEQALQSAKDDRRYTLSEVAARFGIRGRA